MGRTLDCAHCPDRCPDIRKGNYKAMSVYGLICNCVHYISTMDRPLVAGFNWADIEALLRMNRIEPTAPLMKRLRKIESLVIKENVENGSHRNKS